MNYKPPIRVLHIIHRLDRDRGSTAWLLSMLAPMPKSEVEAIVLSLASEKGSREDEFTAAGIRVIHMGCTYKSPIKYSRALWSVFRKERPDVLNSQLGWMGGIDTLVGKLAGIRKRMIYFHSGDWLYASSLPNRIIAAAFKFFGLFSATHYAAGTQAALNRWVPGIFSSRCLLIPPGISFADFSTFNRTEQRRIIGVPEDAWIIGHMGRLSPEKNQSVLIHALSEIRKQEPNAALLLVGDGPDRGKLESLVNELGLTGAVYFLGNRADYSFCLKVCDIFAFPSRFESFGLALLDAQDAGLPIVSSDITALNEVVAPEWHDYRFPPDDGRTLARLLLIIKGRKQSRSDLFLKPFNNDLRCKQLIAYYAT